MARSHQTCSQKALCLVAIFWVTYSWISIGWKFPMSDNHSLCWQLQGRSSLGPNWLENCCDVRQQGRRQWEDYTSNSDQEKYHCFVLIGQLHEPNVWIWISRQLPIAPNILHIKKLCAWWTMTQVSSLGIGSLWKYRYQTTIAPADSFWQIQIDGRTALIPAIKAEDKICDNHASNFN